MKILFIINLFLLYLVSNIHATIINVPADIDSIQVRSFDWIETGEHQKYGTIAQELQSIAPYAVYEPENSEDMMGVDYSKLVPMLIKEIQSLRTRVQELENK